MATIPVSNQATSYSARGLCRIVGFACLAGFVLDAVATAIPFSPGSLEWRVNFMQQFSDRSIILLFGMALVMFGNLDARRWLKRTALISLIAGVVVLLSSILVIRDNLSVQDQAIRNINSRATQLQTQIQQAQANPPANAPSPTADQVQKASQLVNNQAESLKTGAKTTTFKSGFASLTNLVVIGISLISLGRYGSRSRRA